MILNLNLKHYLLSSILVLISWVIKYRGNKVILPKKILYELSNYENVAFPVTLKINDNCFWVYVKKF